MKNSKEGFTIIELLIVIALISVLAGVLIRVINQQRQREYAEDSVARQHLSQAVEVIETYYTAERSFPDQGGAAQDPTLGADSALVDIYLDVWPAGLVYNENGTDYSIHIRKSTTTDYYKYNSIWREIRECADGTNPNSITDCD